MGNCCGASHCAHEPPCPPQAPLVESSLDEACGSQQAELAYHSIPHSPPPNNAISRPLPHPSPLSVSPRCASASPPPRLVETIDNASQLQPLIDYTDRLLKEISNERRSSASERISTSEASVILTNIRLNKTADISTKIDGFLGKVDSMKEEEIKNLARKVLEEEGRVPLTALGFSVIALVLERMSMASSIHRESINLLEKMIRLANQLQEVNKFVSEGVEGINRLCIRSIVDAAITCCRCIHKGQIDGLDTAEAREGSLQEANRDIDNVYREVAFEISMQTLKDESYRPLPLQADLVADIDPVGIDDQVTDVMKLLDMQGATTAIAVNIHGFAGAGKTTLAKSVVSKLDLSGYNLSVVKMDEQNDIPRLQSDILYHLTRGNLNLTDDEHVRAQLLRVLENERNFIFVDNVVKNEDLERLLLKSSPKENQKLRILLTSRQPILTRIHEISCLPYEIELLSDQASKEFLRKKILQSRGASNQDITEAELAQIDSIVAACGGIPLLLEQLGEYLKDYWSPVAYEETLESLSQLEKSELKTI